MRAYERFLNYVKFDTASDPDCMEHPSTKKQKALSSYLADELKALGLVDVCVTKAGYTLGTLPASAGREGDPAIGFIAHIDTSPDISGKDIHARLIKNYDGGDIELCPGCVMSPAVFPHMLDHKGETMIVTDGSTLLGADDKAGIAEIVAALETIITEKRPHAALKIAFTTDEEVGRGVDCFDVPAFGASYAFTLDGGEINRYSCETFNAAAAVIDINGKNIHPGDAKNKMLNACTLAMEFDALLPAGQRPQYTSGREGFYHLNNMTACEEHAKLKYIIRDHDREKFEQKKQLVSDAALFMNRKYGDGTVAAAVTDSYYNMYEILKNYPDIEQKIVKAMRSVGLDPVSEPVRGGTDGARLSFMGLPCPNLPTGGHNYHGRYEYITVEAMDKAVDIILALIA